MFVLNVRECEHGGFGFMYLLLEQADIETKFAIVILNVIKLSCNLTKIELVETAYNLSVRKILQIQVAPPNKFSTFEPTVNHI